MTLPKIDISKTLVGELRRRFTSDPDNREFFDRSHERCGVLLGAMNPDRHYIVSGFCEVPNTHTNPKGSFSMRGEDVRSAGKFAHFTEDDIIGAVHTHPLGSSADPSIDDVLEMPEGLLGIVIHVRTKRLTFYTHKEGFVQKIDLESGAS